MATIAQIQANRLIAEKSTGSRSAEGKASSCFNALKHGAHARIIPGENEADLLDVGRQYYDEFCPEGIVETELVDTLVRCHWEKHRVARLEAAVIKALMSKQEDPEHSLGVSLVADSFGPNILHKLFRRSQPIATGSAPKATSAARPSASPAPPIPHPRKTNPIPTRPPNPSPAPSRRRLNPDPALTILATQTTRPASSARIAAREA